MENRCCIFILYNHNVFKRFDFGVVCAQETEGLLAKFVTLLCQCPMKREMFL